MQKAVASKSKLNLLIRLLFLAWIITKLISLKLWMGDRYFPLVPISDYLLEIPAWVHLALYASSMALMFLSVFKPSKSVIWLIVALEVASCLLDQNRWQPWEYQFLFFVSSFAVFKRDEDKISSWLIILVSTYFFGGFFKLNAAFIHDTWQYLILMKWLHLAPGNIWLLRFGYMLPLLEITAGVLLMIPRFRKAAAWIIISMHIFILILLGPAGLNINAVVWSWNIFLAITVYVLFFQKTENALRLSFSLHPFLVFMLVVWWIMPWFQSFGFWDKYLSSVLYGGGVEQLFICTHNDEALSKASPYRLDKTGTVPCAPVIPVYKWGMYEMKTAPYPERRVTRKIIEYWNRNYGKADFYLFKPGFQTTVKIWDAKNSQWISEK